MSPERYNVSNGRAWVLRLGSNGLLGSSYVVDALEGVRQYSFRT